MKNVRHFSWKKMGESSLAGLKLALMDHEYCVINQKNDPNCIPSFWKGNLTIENLIIDQIHTNKARRQLIIATHNPNIVVNGIAELIISLKFVKGNIQINEIGGLSDEKVRDSVFSKHSKWGLRAWR
jgi:hypothetical protein